VTRQRTPIRLKTSTSSPHPIADDEWWPGRRQLRLRGLPAPREVQPLVVRPNCAPNAVLGLIASERSFAPHKTSPIPAPKAAGTTTFSAPGVVAMRNTPALIKTAPTFIFIVPRHTVQPWPGCFALVTGRKAERKTTPMTTVLSANILTVSSPSSTPNALEQLRRHGLTWRVNPSVQKPVDLGR